MDLDLCASFGTLSDREVVASAVSCHSQLRRGLLSDVVGHRLHTGCHSMLDVMSSGRTASQYSRS